MDTANYEPEIPMTPNGGPFTKNAARKKLLRLLRLQLAVGLQGKICQGCLTALLAAALTRGLPSLLCLCQKHEFDTIDTIDILDCNGGDHGYAFATNFNPEVNLREVSAPGSYWENGHWVEIPAMSIKREYNFDQVGEKDMYLLHHEEIESLAVNIPEVKRIRFFMTFGQSYLDHMRCLEEWACCPPPRWNLKATKLSPSNS